MAGKRPMDLTLLLTNLFTTAVWEQGVEVGLYTLDLMHMEQIAGGAPDEFSSVAE
jgi:hypothetical protein